jgi:4-amino-4-deoxy-L-arabinose transferase-like glycosyltransferase
MPTSYRPWVIATCWLAAVARYRSLFANHFHADEALFAGWARQIAVWRDPLLLTQPVDKPPLLFYLQALAFPLFGPVEWAARLPNFVASLLLVPLVAALAWRLYGDGLTAVTAALLLALSPPAIQFSATAFTDPLLTFWLVTAFALAARPVAGRGRVRASWAGVCFGLAAATKYQAWLFLPLLVALAWLGGWSRREWGRGVTGSAVVGAFVLAWLLARPEAAPLLGQQIANAGGLRLAWSWELWPRLVSWAGLSRLALGWPLLVVFVLAAAVWLLRAWRPERTRSFNPITLLLALFLAAYGVAHWLFAVPVWDRYLLPVLPFALLLVARLVAVALQRLLARDVNGATPRLGQVATVVMVVLLAFPAAGARLGRWPIGGQPTADQGAWRVAEQLREAPYGTVLYDHWYSWQWRYHLFDSGVYVSWFPHSDALREDLAVFGADGSPRYLVLPTGPAADPVRRAVAEAGFVLVAQPPAGVSDPPMMLYRLEKTTR